MAIMSLTLPRWERVSQLVRFELMLLAALGERFIERHPLKDNEWFRGRYSSNLDWIKEKGIKTSIIDL
jgi:hypothetical protein